MILLATSLCACASTPAPAAQPEMPAPMSQRTMTVDSTAKRYTPDMVVNKKDYACGMPVTAGISDTCHYKGKAYGFCSRECMEEFQKDPDKILAVMDGK